MHSNLRRQTNQEQNNCLDALDEILGQLTCSKNRKKCSGFWHHKFNQIQKTFRMLRFLSSKWQNIQDTLFFGIILSFNEFWRIVFEIFIGIVKFPYKFFKCLVKTSLIIKQFFWAYGAIVFKLPLIAWTISWDK